MLHSMSDVIPPQPEPSVEHGPLARWALLAAGAIAIAIIAVPIFLAPDARPLDREWFVGADTYMRMVRVQDWWAGGDWYTSVSARSNWPMGETLHWTRPLDIALIALAAPFWPFIGFHKALFYAGLVVSPVAATLALWALAWGTRYILDVRGQVIMLLLFVFQPLTRYYFMAARPDHHALILLAFTVCLALLLRHASAPEHHRSAIKNAPAWAGIATAFGLWVSVESLTTELLALAALGLAWLITGQVRWLDALRRFTFAGALALVVFLAVERPPTEWLNSEEFDRLSTVQVMLLMLIALGVELMWRTQAQAQINRAVRVALAVFAATLAATLMWGMYPAFFKGPFGAAMDPRLADLWLGKIQELQPLFGANWKNAVEGTYIIGPIAWLAVWLLGRLKTASAQKFFDPVALVLLLVGLLYVPLTVYQVRWGAYLGVGVAVAWAAVVQRVLDWRGGPRIGPEPGTPVLRTPAVVGVVMAHAFVGMVLAMAQPEETAKPATACKWRDLSPVLSTPPFGGGAPQVLLSHIHQGSEILYRTPHRVIGSPYHRNTEGILDNYTILATTVADKAHEILLRRGVDFIVLCTDSPEERHFLKIEGDTLTRQIVDGRAPDWMQKMPLPDGLEEHFRIFRVAKDRAGS